MQRLDQRMTTHLAGLILVGLVMATCARAEETLPLPQLVGPEPPPPIDTSILAAELAKPATVEQMVDQAITPASAEPEPVVLWYHPSYWLGPTPWDSGIEVGINGSDGTSESFSMRTGGYFKREGKDYRLNTSLYYNQTKTAGILSQSNALLDARYDWLFDDSQWSLFLLNQTFYDEFQAFDLNVNVNTGIAYQWYDSDVFKFSTSIGSGASREFGGPDDEWVPEASFGLNFERFIAKSRRLYGKIDYFPEWADFGNYRILVDVGLEVELVEESNISLKFAATDRYDSNPDGVEPHNLNYSVLLLWKM